jgi:hypothetical protein
VFFVFALLVHRKPSEKFAKCERQESKKKRVTEWNVACSKRLVDRSSAARGPLDGDEDLDGSEKILAKLERERNAVKHVP